MRPVRCNATGAVYVLTLPGHSLGELLCCQSERELSPLMRVEGGHRLFADVADPA